MSRSYLAACNVPVGAYRQPDGPYGHVAPYRLSRLSTTFWWAACMRVIDLLGQKNITHALITVNYFIERRWCCYVAVTQRCTAGAEYV